MPARDRTAKAEVTAPSERSVPKATTSLRLELEWLLVWGTEGQGDLREQSRPGRRASVAGVV